MVSFNKNYFPFRSPLALSLSKKNAHPLSINFRIVLPYFRNMGRESTGWCPFLSIIDIGKCDWCFYIVTVFCQSVVIATCYRLVTSWKHNMSLSLPLWYHPRGNLVIGIGMRSSILRIIGLLLLCRINIMI